MRAVPISNAMLAPSSRDGRTLPPRITLPPMPSQYEEALWINSEASVALFVISS
jgi:hypothetical protein